MTPSSTVVLDRGRALREVLALIAEAHANDAAAVVRIAGQPGIGKTTFLEHVLAQRRHSARTLLARAAPAGKTRAASCVRALLGADADSSAGEDELRAALDAAAGESATIAIDDVQWIDELSERIVRAVIRERGASLVVLFTDRRETAPELRPHRTVRLVPLRDDAAAQLVRRAYPGASSQVVSEIVTAASGLPFSLAFLAATAAARAAQSPDDVDPSVSAAVAARLERCEERSREVLRHCALLDQPADLRIVARATELGIAETVGALAELFDVVTVEELRAHFRHALLADAVATATPNPVSYYRRLLSAYDPGDERPETLAAVLRCARGCGDDAVTAASALRLGQIFAAGGSLLTSVDHLKIALRHAPRPLPVPYAIEYASTLQQLARDDEAATFLGAELRGAIARGDAATVAALMTSYSSVALTLEQFTELDALLERVRPIVAGAGATAVAALDTARIAALAFSGRIAEAESAAAAIVPRWGDHRALAYAAALRGEHETALERFETYRAGLGVEHDRLARGDRALLATIGLYRVGNSALCGIDEGWGDERDRGTYATGTALRILRRINDGTWSEIDAIVERLRVDDPDYEEPYAILDARLFFSGLARRAPAAPERTLGAIQTMIRQQRRRHAIGPACWYWVACAYANRTVAPFIVDFVTDYLDVQPMPYLIGSVPLAISLLAPHFGVERCTKAVTAVATFGSRWHRAHAELALGLLARDAVALRRARDAFDGLDAPVLAMVAGMALELPRAADAATARRLGLAGEEDELPLRFARLTPRQRDVANLVAQGLPNAAVAARLGIASVTVELNLTKIYRKLGVHGRAELAHVLSGLVERRS